MTAIAVDPAVSPPSVPSLPPDTDDDRQAPAASLTKIQFRQRPSRPLDESGRKSGDISLVPDALQPQPGLVAAAVETAEDGNEAPAADASPEAASSAPPAPPPAPEPAVAEAAVPLPAEPADEDGTAHAEIIPEQAAPPPLRRRVRKPGNADIYGYWARMRDGRRFPSWADMDPAEIAYHWPNCFLLTCERSAEQRRSVIARATRVTSPETPANPLLEIAFSGAMVDWVLKVGREVIEFGQPLRDSETFDSASRAPTYRIIALPLSERQTAIDHILCWVSRA